MNNKLKVYDIALIAILSSILFVQEEILTFIPNVSFTIFFIVLYTKKLGLLRSSFIVLIHTILDNIYMNSFNIVFFLPMLIGWELIVIITYFFFKRVEKSYILGFSGLIGAFLYSWCFILPSCLFYKMKFSTYMINDILFEVILALCGYISIAILYKPLSKVFDQINARRN